MKLAQEIINGFKEKAPKFQLGGGKTDPTTKTGLELISNLEKMVKNAEAIRVPTAAAAMKKAIELIKKKIKP